MVFRVRNLHILFPQLLEGNWTDRYGLGNVHAHLFPTERETSVQLSLISCSFHFYSTVVWGRELTFVPLMFSSHGCLYQPPSELVTYVSWQFVPIEDTLLFLLCKEVVPFPLLLQTAGTDWTVAEGKTLLSIFNTWIRPCLLLSWLL